MSQKTDLNISPYFDDFDEDKNFYRVLFKPGYPVQARELTSIQSALQNQIEQLGNFTLKSEGTVVIPGNWEYTNQFDAVELEPFFNYCKNEVNLNILGLMVIPPNDNNPEKYFKSLNELNRSLALQELSMGMSADYIEAVKHGSTFIRVGSSIFGVRS